MSHESGSLEFEAAPPEWFREKGINTPVWCPDCRKWRDAQVDEAVRCIECGEGIRLSRRLKISIHKKEGPFRRPEKCKLCESGKRKKMAARVARRPPKRKLSMSVLNRLERLAASGEANPLEVVIDTSDYQFQIRDGQGRLHTRQEHFERHIDGHPNSMVGSGEDDKSPTSLVPPGASVEELLAEVARIAQLTDPLQVRHYEQADGNIVIVYAGFGRLAEKIVINPGGSNGPELVTCFDKITAEALVGSLRRYGVE
jgi:hypothetical protein